MPEPRPVETILADKFASVTAITFYTREDQVALAEQIATIASKLSIRGRTGFKSPRQWNDMCSELERIAAEVKQAAGY